MLWDSHQLCLNQSVLDDALNFLVYTVASGSSGDRGDTGYG